MPRSQSPSQRLTGDDPDGIYTAMATHMAKLDWTIQRQPIAGETNGYTTTDVTKQTAIEADLSPAQAAKTATGCRRGSFS